jgi:hypothetical protein
MFWPCETRTSTCRSFATISSGLYRFLAIAVLLDVKDIPQVGPLQWGWITFGVGQGIGVTEAMITLPIITTIWPGTYPNIFDAGFGIGFVISALMAPIPFFGLIGWLVGQLIAHSSKLSDAYRGRQLLGQPPRGLAIATGVIARWLLSSGLRAERVLGLRAARNCARTEAIGAAC